MAKSVGTVYVQVKPDYTPMKEALSKLADGYLEMAKIAIDLAVFLEDKEITSGR